MLFSSEILPSGHLSVMFLTGRYELRINYSQSLMGTNIFVEKILGENERRSDMCRRCDGIICL